jgi:hypothetical protein
MAAAIVVDGAVTDRVWKLLKRLYLAEYNLGFAP